MSSIGKTEVGLSQSWGVSFNDYQIAISGVTTDVDFQDLMIEVSQKRAVTVEGEVTPLTTRIRARNTLLENLGTALSELTKLQSVFKNDDGGWKRTGEYNVYLTANTRDNILAKTFTLDFSDLSMTKFEVEEWVQKVKSKIDALNNEAQSDMSRLQSLVDRRDESYSTASTLMTSISDTRSNTIRNY